MFWGINLSSFGLCGKGFYPPRGLPGRQLFIFTGSNNSFFFFLFRDRKLCASLVSDTFDWGGGKLREVLWVGVWPLMLVTCHVMLSF